MLKAFLVKAMILRELFQQTEFNGVKELLFSENQWGNDESLFQ